MVVPPPPPSRTIRISVILFGLATAASCVGAFLLAQNLGRWFGGEPAQTAAPTEYECGGLVVAAPDLDLSEVWETKEFAHELPIRNPSGSEVKIDNFVTSCLCTAVEPQAVVIPAGKTVAVRVLIDPNHRSPDEANLAARPFGVDITPVCDERRPPKPGWRMHGTFMSRVTFGVLSVHFGETVVQGMPPPTRDVLATLHVPMQHLEARVEPAGVASAAVVPRAGQVDAVTMRITPSNTLPLGPFKATVFVDVVDDAGRVLPGAILPIAGDVQAETRLLPARVFLGIHRVGTTAETTVVLQAPAEATWTVAHIETDSADVSAEETRAEGIAVGRAFRVTQRIAREGDQKGAVRFIVRKAGGPAMTLTMEIISHGELPRQAEPSESGGKQP